MYSNVNNVKHTAYGLGILRWNVKLLALFQVNGTIHCYTTDFWRVYLIHLRNINGISSNESGRVTNLFGGQRGKIDASMIWTHRRCYGPTVDGLDPDGRHFPVCWTLPEVARWTHRLLD